MKQSEKVLAGITAAVVSTVVLWSWVAQPTIERWRAANEREETLQEKLARWQTLVGKAQQLRADRDGIDVALAPPEPDPGTAVRSGAAGIAEAGFLTHLSTLTEATGIRPSVLRYVRTEGVPIDGKDAYAELRFELKARAPLKQIHDFLVRMTSSDWYLRVQSLTLSPRENGELEADMSVVALATVDALEDDAKPQPKGGHR